MKTNTSIILGNASTSNTIHFRKQSFITEINRSHLEKCIRTFITLPIPSAFYTLVKMTCLQKKDIPQELWENIHLDPSLIPDKAWNSFLNELRYQYKITHPTFMAEFIIPDECLVAYDNLVSHTSEVAAYLFYKKVSDFLYDHIEADIGQDHITDTFNRLTWHSRNTEVNRIQQIKGLKRFSLKEYEAIYFQNHLEECIALFQSIWSYVQMDEPPCTMDPVKFSEADDDDLPFFFVDSNNTPVTETKEKPFLELSLENILAYEKDFLDFILNQDKACKTRLHDAGFDMEQVLSKTFAIHWVLRTHSEMEKALEALYK